jgi:hypothetical protein
VGGREDVVGRDEGAAAERLRAGRHHKADLWSSANRHNLGVR